MGQTDEDVKIYGFVCSLLQYYIRLSTGFSFFFQLGFSTAFYSYTQVYTYSKNNKIFRILVIL